MPADMIEALDRAPQRAKAARKPFELKGGHVLALIVAFFAVVAAVNATMMTIAIRTMPGLDARNGYDPSQAYNRELAAARAQETLGWNAATTVSLRGDVAHLSVALSDRDGRPLPGAIITARLQHPSDRKKDRAAALAPDGGSFEGDAVGVSEGFWDLVIEARGSADEPPLFVSRRRIRLKA